MVRLGHRSPPAGRGRRQQHQQPAASSSSQQHRPEGHARGRGEGSAGRELGRGAAGGRDRAPLEGRTPSPQPRRGRGGAGCCQGARCCCCQGLGRWLWVGDALLCGRGGRAAADPPARVPGARGRTPWRRCGPRRVPKAAGIQGPDARSTIAVESKIGVDLGGFFAVFAVAIWRWGKRLKFNVENSASAPWLLSARQKLA